MLDVFIKAGRGLAAAHDAGLLHRDFKPDNVLVGNDGRVRVADFGLARDFEPPPPPSYSIGGSPKTPPLPVVRTNELAGTPGYMSPEQRAGAPLDARADQYSFCISLREALTRAPNVPRWVHRVLARGLEDSPAKRWPSMHALVARIERRLRWRRIGLLAAGAAGVVLAAAAVTLVSRPQRGGDRLCSGSTERIDAVWNARRADGVRSAIAAGGGPAERGAADAAVGSLTRYADAWARAHREVCVATRIRGEQSERVMEARMLCLDRALLRLSATIDVLATDRQTAARALDAIDALPPLSRCERESPSSEAAAPPDDPQAALDAENLRRDLARVTALVASGRSRYAVEAATRAVEQARRLDQAPLRAEALYYLGASLAQQRRSAEAEAAYRESIDHALASGRDELAIIALADLGGALADAQRIDEAESWLRVADALLVRVGDPTLEPYVLSRWVVVRERQGRYADAEQAARRAIELEARPDSRKVGPGLVQVATTLAYQGRVNAAKLVLLEAIDTLERTPGADPARVVDALRLLGAMNLRLGGLDEAEQNMRRALDLDAQRLGPDSPLLAGHYGDLGAVLREKRDADAAIATLERAIALHARSPEPDAKQLCALRLDLAASYALADRQPDALAHAERAITELERALPAESVELVAPRTEVGRLQRELGLTTLSLRTLTDVVAMADRTLAAGRPDRLLAHVELAKTQLALDRTAEAVAGLQPAIDALGDASTEGPAVPVARFTLAQALWRDARGGAEDRARAVTLANQALDDYSRLGDAFIEERAQVESWLSQR